MAMVLSLALVLLAAAAIPLHAADVPVRPNVLLILADDLGFSNLGCYGSDIATPNLDQLAAKGLRFTQFYNTARCWPTRSALLTGYYPQQIHMDRPRGRLPPWTRTLAHWLKPAGYRSYHSGKWHVNGAPRPVADGGFDHSYDLEDHDTWELFNLADDRCEQHNLAAAQPDRVRSMATRWQELQDQFTRDAGAVLPMTRTSN